MIGALVFVLLQDFVMSMTQYWRFVMGAVLVLLVVFMPQGLSGTDRAAASTGATEGDEMQPARRPNAAPLFETINVSKRYGAFKALSDVSFHVNDGEFVSDRRPERRGQDDAGQRRHRVAAADGRRGALPGPATSPASARSNWRGCGMSRAFQLVNIFPALTVRETLAVAVPPGCAASPIRSARCGATTCCRPMSERIADVLGLRARLETVGLDAVAGREEAAGYRQRVRAQSAVILLDEPTSGVSTGDKHAIMEVLVSAAKAAGVRGIVQVEHDMDLVERYSHRIVALAGGPRAGRHGARRVLQGPRR